MDTKICVALARLIQIINVTKWKEKFGISHAMDRDKP